MSENWDKHTAYRSYDTVIANLWYPRSDTKSDDSVRYVRVGLVDVRAADDILITYDFDRDGYVISQQTSEDWDAEWKEVAFVKAWGLSE